MPLNAILTGLLAVLNLLAVAVLAAIGTPIPPPLYQTLFGLIAGHLALATPGQAPTAYEARPRAPPAPQAPVAAPGSAQD